MSRYTFSTPIIFSGMLWLAGPGNCAAAEPTAPVVKLAAPFGLARGPVVIDGDPVEWGGMHDVSGGSLTFKSAHKEFWGGTLREAFTATISVFDTRGKVLANGRLAYDETNLYCAVIVPRAPLLNNSSSPQELLYGGDTIGICVGPSGGKGANQRFVCGMYAGKPTVVAMREQWPLAKPYTYFTEAGER